MEFNEYPKALYKAGAYAEVQDAAEEDAKRADGFTDWQADQDAMAPADEASDGLTRDEMKARAKDLGLAFKHNISNAALAELIATAS